MFNLHRIVFVVPAIIVALTFHEYAHARVSYAFGDPTPREEGRMTLNPLRHLDIVGTLLLIIAGFGWAKPVPINPWYYGAKRKQKLVLVSAAGPVMNLLEAFVGAGLLALIYHFSSGESLVIGYFFSFLYYFVSINLTLAVFNLIPIPPLDGSKILGGLLPDRHMHIAFSLEQYGFGILLLLVFIPDILGILGLPRIDVLGIIISTPANWMMNGLFRLFGIF